jgi:dTDP-4-dehydrorhamnose reductase
MVQVSTDYVFDGSQTKPYQPNDPVNPINVYGESKLAGELVTREIAGDDLLIVRTAWVYALHGKNFVTTMLRLMQERGELNIVEDQIGTPTSAFSLAAVIYISIKKKLSGTHHWTDVGVASWYDFSCAIYELAIDAGLLTNKCSIRPISSDAYPVPARRPVWSVLDKRSFRDSLGYIGEQWRFVLKQMIDSGRREERI